MDVPTINLLDDFCSLTLCLSCQLNVLDYPLDEVVLERSLDELMQEIRRQEFMDVCPREVVCEWLPEHVRLSLGAQYEYKPETTNLDSCNNTEDIPQLLRCECVKKSLRVLAKARIAGCLKLMGICEASAEFMLSKRARGLTVLEMQT